MSIIINIANWDSCKKTAFASTWDDFCIESWKKLVSYGNLKDIPLTFFINTCGYCEAGKFQKDNDKIGPKTKMSKKDIQFYKKIVKEGHEIGGHTTRHYDMRKMNNIDIENDCKKWISIMEKELSIKSQIDFLPMQPGDVKDGFADIEYSTQKLGYKPKVDIVDGIPIFLDWYKSYYV